MRFQAGGPLGKPSVLSLQEARQSGSPGPAQGVSEPLHKDKGHRSGSSSGEGWALLAKAPPRCCAPCTGAVATAVSRREAAGGSREGEERSRAEPVLSAGGETFHDLPANLGGQITREALRTHPQCRSGSGHHRAADCVHIRDTSLSAVHRATSCPCSPVTRGPRSPSTQAACAERLRRWWPGGRENTPYVFPKV